MVIILMSTDEAGAAAAARALSVSLGWPHTRGGDPNALHAAIAHVLSRREHLLVASAPLTEAEQDMARGDLHGVRFVDLTEPENADEIVRSIRRECGL